MTYVKPKKALGQHFLTDQRVAARIAATLDGCGDMPVLEIGPGTGALTQHLIRPGRELTAIEVDTESIDCLRERWPDLRVVHADFLQADIAELMGGRPFCLIGNYPYNISSQIFFKALEYKDMIPCIAGMLQREVAERITAAEGGKERGILSVLLQAWYDAEYLFTVSEHVFNPPPKVKSGVIRLTRNSRQSLPCDERLLRTVVKTTFGMRRKTLRNSTRSLLPPGAAIDSPLMAMRPEQLSVEQFFELTNLIANSQRP